MRKFASAIAATAMMLAVPISSANAANAERLSVSASVAKGNPAAAQRVGAPIGKQSELRGGFIIPLVAIIAIILGVLAATGGNDRPHTP